MIANIISELFPIILQLWWLLLLAIIVAISRTPIVKGCIGELLVNILAAICLNKKGYTLLKNVTLPTKNGTTQIDHIIVSAYGVFVVETKNYKGNIYGSLDHRQREWTCNKTKFQNPLRQNYKHTKTLEKLLDLPADKVHSVIVFIGTSKFKTKMPENVKPGLGYIRYIKSFKDVVLSDTSVKDIVQNISSGRLKPSLKTHREHVKHVKEIVANRNEDYSRFMPNQEYVAKVAQNTDSSKSTKATQISTGYCPDCKEPMDFCQKGEKHFWRCTDCNKDFYINELCSQCGNAMDLIFKADQYFLKCGNCNIEGAYC